MQENNNKRTDQIQSASLPKDWMSHEWQDIKNKHKKLPPFIIGVAGGTASGKTSVCELIMQQLKNRRVAMMSLDSFYRPLSHEERANVREYNFDHPDAFDWDLLSETLKSLRDGKSVNIPVYDFVTHSRAPDKSTTIYGADVIIIEGILIFYIAEMRNIMDMKIFVDADSDTRLARRIVRDINQRGRDIMGVIRQYERSVKPAFEEYVLPTKKICRCYYS